MFQLTTSEYPIPMLTLPFRNSTNSRWRCLAAASSRATARVATRQAPSETSSMKCGFDLMKMNYFRTISHLSGESSSGGDIPCSNVTLLATMPRCHDAENVQRQQTENLISHPSHQSTEAGGMDSIGPFRVGCFNHGSMLCGKKGLRAPATTYCSLQRFKMVQLGMEASGEQFPSRETASTPFTLDQLPKLGT